VTRSLRRALAVRFAATMAVALTAGSALVCWGAARVLERELDQALALTAFFTGEILADADRPAPDLLVPGDAETYRRDVNRYAALRDGRGRVLAALPALAAELPLDTAALAAALAGAPVRGTSEWHGEEFRTLYRRLDADTRRVVQVAASRAPLRAVRHDLVAAMAVVVVLGTLATFLGAWGLAGTAVRPVAEITAQARHVEAGTLDHRIVVHANTEEYEGLVAVLNRMLDRLEAAFRTQRRLTADVSHELRTPLTALRGEIEVALRSVRSADDYRRVLRSALEEIDRLIELTEELFLVTRAEARLIAPERQTTDVNAVVRDALGRLRERVAEKGLTVEQSLAAPPVSIDPRLFAALAARLLDNAVKFTPEGGRVRVMTQAHDGGLRFAVEDSGHGIAVDDLPHVFDPFFRADQARTRGGGTGMGLTLAAAVTRLHGGTIAASNLGTGGARFQVDFPAPTPD
jgi:two-component system OmpR family sensor kinase